MVQCPLCPKKFPKGTSIKNHIRWHNKSYRENIAKKISEKAKGRTAWNKGLTKEDPRVKRYARTLSKHRKGENNPYYGHGVRPTKQKIVDLYINQKYSRQQIADTLKVKKITVDKWLKLYKITLPCDERNKRRTAHTHLLENRQQNSQRMKKIVAQKLDMYLRNLFLTSKPTSIEIQFMEMCKKHNFPFKYVGDGKFWIGRRNPDFINLENRLIVEVLGEYWHTPKEAEARKIFFVNKGYQTLLIWQSELKNEEEVIQKVKSWLHGSIILQTQ